MSIKAALKSKVFLVCWKRKPNSLSHSIQNHVCLFHIFRSVDELYEHTNCTKTLLITIINPCIYIYEYPYKIVRILKNV